MKDLSLFGYTLPRTAMLAPMAGIADRAYRQLCKRYGAVLVVGEMASVKGLCYSDRKTAELLTCTQEEFPMGVQLFGDDPAFFAKAAKIAAAYHPAFIDINMGCPVHKVVSTGAGSRLMTTPQKAAQIVRACVEAVDLPITVKMRKGYDAQDANAPELARLCEAEGAVAITIHGRTKAQLYQPGADWEIIRKVKQAVSIPVIGNGDVMSAKDAQAMYRQTGCDLVAVARGSYGRPWIFSQITQYLNTGALPPRKKKWRLCWNTSPLSVNTKGSGRECGKGAKSPDFMSRDWPRPAGSGENAAACPPWKTPKLWPGRFSPPKKRNPEKRNCIEWNVLTKQSPGPCKRPIK